jgi:hypothetical protein
MGDPKKTTGVLIDELRKKNPDADPKTIGKQIPKLRDAAEGAAGKTPKK